MKIAWRWMAAAAVGAAVAAAAESAAPAAPGAPRLGCQMRTFGRGVYPDEAEFVRLVRLAGAAGFTGIETNWKNLERWFDRPAAFAALLKDARLELIGAHMSGNPWGAASRKSLRDDVERTARFVKAMGGGFIVLSGGQPPKPARFVDRLPEMAALLDEVGARCATQGVRLLYHNHWQDCEDGALPKLARLTDPGKVGFAFDTGHAVRVGVDPAAVIAALGPRLGLVHFADFAMDDPSNVKRPPLGTGRLDVAAAAAAIRKAGAARWIVLEEESSEGGGEDLAKKGLAVLRRAFPESIPEAK